MFTVCLIAPPGYPHSMRFMEQASLLRGALGTLGVACRFSLGALEPGRINIVLGYHLLDPSDIPSDAVYICRQLEQLNSEFFEARPEALEVLAGASEIWDYAEGNVDFLAGLGLSAKLLSPGHHECLETISQGAPKDIDVLFYGALNKRSEDTLAACVRLGLRTEFLSGVYHSERDQAIARARIVLNLHSCDECIFESVRVTHLWNNRVFVISEKPGRYPYPGVPLAVAPHERLPQACAGYLERFDQCRGLALESYRQFKRLYPMTKFLWRVLDSRLMATVRRQSRPHRPEADRPHLR
jgi:hypothetical protein